MKRPLFLAAVLGLGLVLSAMSYSAHLEVVGHELLAAQPAGEFPLMLRLNGSPAFIGHQAPGADGGTIGKVDAGWGECVKTQCYSPACVCAATTCTCGAALASTYSATNGEYLAAYGISYMCLAVNNGMVSTAAAPGSLLVDGGAGADCDSWVMK